ncbi:MAG: cryptic adenine deaminase [Candidatus Bathyarchaeota archaeon BA1]|nr:MAG: cryptic adenine deaminase [Candidatus Bathyarchaeota archaeon BA1]
MTSQFEEINVFKKLLVKRTRLEDVTKLLVDTAMGREKADLVIRGGNLVNVSSGELLENMDVAIKRDRIALVGRAGHTIGNKTTVMEATGKYLVPGFLDGHVHIESSMITVTQFARAVLPHGTTSVFIDPHEIANVLGLEGVRLMLDEAKGLPLKVFVCIPSCVPAAPGFETAGAEITPADVEEALRWEGVIGLGEMMNYPGVLHGDEKVHGEIQAALRANKVVEGHSNGLLDMELAAYAAAGITSCHESTRKIDGIQRLRLGLYTMIREGSAWRDVAEVIKCVTEQRLDPRHVILVTDDRHPETLMTRGHLNDVVRRAIEEGVDPITAVQMATLNTAEHYGVSRDIGSIAPSKSADILILNNLSGVSVDTVIADGVVVANQGRMLIDLAPPQHPDLVRRSIHLKRPITAGDLSIKAPTRNGTVMVHVIGVVEAKVVTRHLQEELPVKDGVVQPSIAKDIAKVAAVERHKQTGNIGLGFVSGFGFKEGAVASSVAHDSHNLLVVGMNDHDMAFAINKLAEVGGGMTAVKNGEVIGLVVLPIAGLMSDEPLEKVCEHVEKLQNAWVELGCTMASPFMTMSLLALPVLPELRITDKGLVDTQRFRFVKLMVG